MEDLQDKPTPRRGRPPKAQPVIPPTRKEREPPRSPWLKCGVEERAKRRAEAIEAVTRYGTLRIAAEKMGCHEDDVPRYYGHRWAGDYAQALKRHISLAYERHVDFAMVDRKANLDLLEALQPEKFGTVRVKQESEHTERHIEEKKLTIEMRSTPELLDQLRTLSPNLAAAIADPLKLQRLLTMAEEQQALDITPKGN